MLSSGKPFNSSPVSEGSSAEIAEQCFGFTQLLSRFLGATIASEPFTVNESGAGEVPTHWRVRHSIDRLLVERLSCVTVGEERTTPSLDRACPVGATRRCSFGHEN